MRGDKDDKEQIFIRDYKNDKEQPLMKGDKHDKGPAKTALGYSSRAGASFLIHSGRALEMEVRTAWRRSSRVLKSLG